MEDSVQELKDTLLYYDEDVILEVLLQANIVGPDGKLTDFWQSLLSMAPQDP